VSKNYRSKLVGVFGCPVDENPSVIMNEAAFASKGLDWRYITMLVRPEDLEAAIAGLRAMNFEGVNLTIPHKSEAMKYVDEVSEGAKLIGAINIIVRKDNKLIGDNTDGRGLVNALAEKGIDLKGKEVTVLGAGGASKAICVEFALAGCSSIHIFNRTLEKAENIAKVINSNTACKAVAGEWKDTLKIPPCDILVNATSIGLYPDKSFPDICYEDITPQMYVQDIIPNPAMTLFLKKAIERGASVGDGLSMLAHQGAIGFKLWTGLEAPYEVMKDALKNI
jgi:shikimate dehydrogenase